MERAYTIKEIDDLRACCEHKWLWGTWFYQRIRFSTADGRLVIHGSSSRAYKEGEKAKAVEELVRTYMFAGKTADDIRAEYYDAEKADFEQSMSDLHRAEKEFAAANKGD